MKLEKAPWATIVMGVVAVIIVAVGGVSVITGDLAYEKWLDTLKQFAIGVGLLGVGRGVAAGLKAK